MSSGRYPSSSSERKKYTEEEQKLINFMREARSQPIIYDQYDPTNRINEQDIIANASEIIHIPPQYQRFNSSLDLPQAAAAMIRHSPSATRTLVRTDTGQYYIEVNAAATAQTSSNTTGNREDTNCLQSDIQQRSLDQPSKTNQSTKNFHHTD